MGERWMGERWMGERKCGGRGDTKPTPTDKTYLNLHMRLIEGLWLTFFRRLLTFVHPHAFLDGGLMINEGLSSTVLDVKIMIKRY